MSERKFNWKVKGSGDFMECDVTFSGCDLKLLTELFSLCISRGDSVKKHGYAFYLTVCKRSTVFHFDASYIDLGVLGRLEEFCALKKSAFDEDLADQPTSTEEDQNND